MELHLIQTFAARAVGVQLRHALIGHARQLLRLMRSDVAAELVELVPQIARQAGREIDDQRIGTIGVDTGPEAWLVQFGERFFCPGILGHPLLLAVLYWRCIVG
ncbi:hypothetical protein D3C72_841030 [compost metagenome]